MLTKETASDPTARTSYWSGVRFRDTYLYNGQGHIEGVRHEGQIAVMCVNVMYPGTNLPTQVVMCKKRDICHFPYYVDQLLRHHYDDCTRM
jgi:hypothetical protein